MSDDNAVLLAVVVGALLAAAVLIGTGLAGSSGGSGGQQDGITVSANGEASAEPDKAVLSVAVEATASEPSAARDQVATDVDRMRTALRNAGVTDDQVTTTSFEIGEEIRRRPPRPGETDGEEEPRFQATHRFEIELNDTGSVGGVIDTAVNNGATRVDGVRLTLTDATRREVRDRALERAMSHAEDQADTLATEAGLSLGTVRSIATSDTGVSPVHFERAQLSADAGGGGTSIESGPVTVNANVNVVYATG